MLLTESQAAREAQVDKRTLRRLILAGRLRASDFGTRGRRFFRIDPDDLKKVLSQPSVSATPTPPLPPSRRRRRAASSSSLAAFLPSV